MEPGNHQTRHRKAGRGIHESLNLAFYLVGVCLLQ